MSNSARRDRQHRARTARRTSERPTAYLLLLENSLLTPLPYNVVPYCNLFAGFDRPQPLGRLQGPLKNTGINFESDLLTGYPLLDDSANNTYGGAFGVDLLGRQFDRQLILEAAVLQAFDDPAGRIAPGDQYAARRALPATAEQRPHPASRRDARLAGEFRTTSTACAWSCGTSSNARDDPSHRDSRDATRRRGVALDRCATASPAIVASRYGVAAP